MKTGKVWKGERVKGVFMKDKPLCDRIDTGRVEKSDYENSRGKRLLDWALRIPVLPGTTAKGAPDNEHLRPPSFWEAWTGIF